MHRRAHGLDTVSPSARCLFDGAHSNREVGGLKVYKTKETPSVLLTHFSVHLRKSREKQTGYKHIFLTARKHIEAFLVVDLRGRHVAISFFSQLLFF